MKELEHRKLCFARWIYHRQHQKTPSRRSTWAERFRKIYGEDYGEYVERMRRQK